MNFLSYPTLASITPHFSQAGHNHSTPFSPTLPSTVFYSSCHQTGQTLTALLLHLHIGMGSPNQISMLVCLCSPIQAHNFLPSKFDLGLILLKNLNPLFDLFWLCKKRRETLGVKPLLCTVQGKVKEYINMLTKVMKMLHFASFPQ